MNAKTFFLVAALSAASASFAQEQRTNANELPSAVQRALNHVAKGEPIKSVRRETIERETIYNIELDRKNAPNPHLRITEDGLVLIGTGGPLVVPPADALVPYDAPILPVDPVVSLGEVPAAVRETIKRESAGRAIVDIDRETWRGRVVYEVEFKASGRNPQIHIAEDGAILKEDTTRRSGLRSWFMGTQLEDTPPAVQETIRREASGGEVKDIDVRRRAGARVYETEIKDARGREFQLQIGEDGGVVHDTREPLNPPKRG